MMSTPSTRAPFTGSWSSATVKLRLLEAIAKLFQFRDLASQRIRLASLWGVYLWSFSVEKQCVSAREAKRPQKRRRLLHHGRAEIPGYILQLSLKSLFIHHHRHKVDEKHRLHEDHKSMQEIGALFSYQVSQ